MIRLKVQYTVQVNSYSSVLVSAGIEYDEEATDQEIAALVEGPVERGFAPLSRHIIAKGKELAQAERARLAEECRQVAA